GGPTLRPPGAGGPAAGRSEQAGRGQRGGQPRGQQARPPAAASGSQFLSARGPVVVFHVVSPVTGWMCACESWLYAGAGFGPVSIAAGPFPVVAGRPGATGRPARGRDRGRNRAEPPGGAWRPRPTTPASGLHQPAAATRQAGQVVLARPVGGLVPRRVRVQVGARLLLNL